MVEELSEQATIIPLPYAPIEPNVAVTGSVEVLHVTPLSVEYSAAVPAVLLNRAILPAEFVKASEIAPVGGDGIVMLVHVVPLSALCKSLDVTPGDGIKYLPKLQITLFFTRMLTSTVTKELTVIDTVVNRAASCG